VRTALAIWDEEYVELLEQIHPDVEVDWALLKLDQTKTAKDLWSLPHTRLETEKSPQIEAG
jgi:hypothetical protein